LILLNTVFERYCKKIPKLSKESIKNIDKIRANVVLWIEVLVQDFDEKIGVALLY
jgi:hypothetical protein